MSWCSVAIFVHGQVEAHKISYSECEDILEYLKHHLGNSIYNITDFDVDAGNARDSGYIIKIVDEYIRKQGVI